MANLNVLDSAGKFTDPGDGALAALDNETRARIVDIRNATREFDAAAAAIVANEKALTETRAEIAALQKIAPKQTFNDLAKGMAAETQRRRAGLQ